MGMLLSHLTLRKKCQTPLMTISSHYHPVHKISRRQGLLDHPTLTHQLIERSRLRWLAPLGTIWKEIQSRLLEPQRFNVLILPNVSNLEKAVSQWENTTVNFAAWMFLKVSHECSVSQFIFLEAQHQLTLQKMNTNAECDRPHSPRSLRKPQSKQAKVRQMETAERQVHMGIQTDGRMRHSTCFWHRTSTHAAWFRVEKNHRGI